MEKKKERDGDEEEEEQIRAREAAAIVGAEEMRALGCSVGVLQAIILNYTSSRVLDVHGLVNGLGLSHNATLSCLDYLEKTLVFRMNYKKSN